MRWAGLMNKSILPVQITEKDFSHRIINGRAGEV